MKIRVLNTALVDKHTVRSLTLVADLAMISYGKIKELLNHRLNYIVEARLGNLSGDKIEEIDQMLLRKDGHTIRIKTDNGDLICSYSHPFVTGKTSMKCKSRLTKQSQS